MTGELERHLQSQLPDPAIPGTSNLPDVAVDIAVGIGELSMIECVKEFRAKFEQNSLKLWCSYGTQDPSC
jgi:hypothetical protein